MSKDATVAFDASQLLEKLKSTEQEASEKPAALLIVGGELNGHLFDLDKEEITGGRNPDNDISLESDGISRYHFKIVAINKEHQLEDNGSRNGTFLNEQKVEEKMVLKKGDIIKLGTVSLKYLPKGDPERLTYDKLSLDARTDGHTGCFNKTYFNDALNLQLRKAKLKGWPLSLIIFDLDHFKQLNDNYGHDAGDFVLKELADLIRKERGDTEDIFARYGGEEFCILLPKTNLKNAFTIAESLRKSVEDHAFMYEDKRLPVSASIGLADYRKGVRDGQTLFKRADEAVYKSKEGGRNRVSFYRDS